MWDTLYISRNMVGGVNYLWGKVTFETFPGDDDYSSDEEILYNDAWEGMKMRGKGSARPDTPSGSFIHKSLHSFTNSFIH